jgi:hypothetical protein
MSLGCTVQYSTVQYVYACTDAHAHGVYWIDAQRALAQCIAEGAVVDLRILPGSLHRCCGYAAYPERNAYGRASARDDLFTGEQRRPTLKASNHRCEPVNGSKLECVPTLRREFFSQLLAKFRR